MMQLSRASRGAFGAGMSQIGRVAPRLPMRMVRPASQPARHFASVFAPHDTFARRHIGPYNTPEREKMLATVGVKSMDELLQRVLPSNIRLKGEMQLSPAKAEAEMLAEFKTMLSKNKINRSHIGAGYYNTHTPAVILRNMIENPGWYTPYTPYQPEISQGRLEMLLNFQTMVSDLTGLPVANSSLLDEATAAAEAMNMSWSHGKKSTFLVSDSVHAQTISVLRTRAAPVGINVEVKHHSLFDFSKGDVFGMMLQYPCASGVVEEYAKLAEKARAAGVTVTVASDLLALTVLRPPGEWGADVVVGNSQRFGVPLGFGGPHAGFLATNENNKRKLPGRVIGVSRDSRGKPALRMAMQTREQHIRRDKATSNICTAQALLANVAAAYGIYHGPDGLKQIAFKVHAAARTFSAGVTKLGLGTPSGANIFDTVHVDLKGANNAQKYIEACEKRHINIRLVDSNNLTVAFDETVTAKHIDDLIEAFSEAKGVKVDFTAESFAAKGDVSVPSAFARTSEFMTHPIFNMYRSETDLMRYLFTLQSKDLSLQTAMIPLGSCTMKLNAASEMIPVTLPEVGGMHPFAPESQTKGYQEMLRNLEKDLCEITGFHAVSLQPNAGSQGEYAGLLAIRQYHLSRGDKQRNVCLIPTSAHGTNPASAVMAGMKVVVVKCQEDGEIDLEDLTAKAVQHKNELSCLMITYPSTHGVFEENIRDVCKLIHDNGGQVYMDGANMNAQVGLTSPGFIGADVCHLNLHKTFCIPHGGGGPGMGPIGVAKHLAPFLPSHPLATLKENQVGAVTAAPVSSASILPISYMYIRMMGAKGLREATEHAILSANYMAARLRGHYDVLFTGAHGMCAHEFIIDLRPFKATTGIVEEDVAKRLMDFNFHAPTMSWPVVGTLMIEPTESEPLFELDRFCDAMIAIREEIRSIENGTMHKENNPLKRAPHTADTVISTAWDRPYSREQAAYPLPYLKANKFWPSVGRLDNVFGDRNVVCTCPPLEAYSS